MAARQTRQTKRSGATTRRSPKKSASRGIPGWLWGIAGLVAGFFLAQYLQQQAPVPLATVVPKPPSNSTSDAGSGNEEAAASSAQRMPTFEFYTLLPESEVVAPRSEAAATRNPPPAAPQPETPTATDPIAEQLASINEAVERSMASRDESAATVQTPQPDADPSRYMLQAASFKETGDAQRLAGKLRDFGLLAQITEVQAGDGATWHRVQVGPYNDRRELNRAQDLMITQGIEPLLIRLQN
ncbi:SPOR domain-containing protein [Litchfieldella xinjiangensis]|uniref:SPOR domain-containing protein n=1 Tax=Litchfieldella xinjiangensis TaxID=1166948 RepID=UPI0005B8DB12|nr:SPOR domain-containing protein [Halomonas xinjiangensis]